MQIQGNRQTLALQPQKHLFTLLHLNPDDAVKWGNKYRCSRNTYISPPPAAAAGSNAIPSIDAVTPLRGSWHDADKNTIVITLSLVQQQENH